MVASPPHQQQRRRLRRLSHHLAPAGSATDAAALGGGRWAGHGDPSRRFPSTAATNDPAVATERLRRDGFVVVKGMLTEADAARHRTELSAHMADIDAVLADAERGGRGEASRGANNRMEALKSYFPEALGLPGVGNYGITGYIRFAPEWAEIGTAPNIVTDVISATMGEDYNLVYTTGFLKMPDSGGTWGPSYHTDGPDIFQFGRQQVDVVTRVTCLVMLSDFTAKTGATVVNRLSSPRVGGRAGQRCVDAG